MEFTGQLRQGFVLGKPLAQDRYDEKKSVTVLEEQGRLIKTRKRDGWKVFAAVDHRGKVRLYTDGINEIDARLAHIQAELAKLRLPPRSLLVGECVFDFQGADDLTKVQTLFSRSLDGAKELQREVGHARFMVFGLVFLAGRHVTAPHRENLAMTRSLLAKAKTPHVFPVPVLEMSLDEAKETVRREGWEGLVLYSADFVNTYRTDGKSPQRPDGCYKWKPVREDDFIVREYIPRPNGEVKEIVLFQIDPTTGREFYCGKLGTFSRATRAAFADLSRYPFVVQAEFEARFPKTGKIRSARFVRVREDKPLADCRAPQSYAEAVPADRYKNRRLAVSGSS